MTIAIENVPVNEAVQMFLEITGVVVTGRTGLTRNLLPRAQHSGLIEPRDPGDHRHECTRHVVKRAHVVVPGQMAGITMVGDGFPELFELGDTIFGLVTRNN